MTINLESLLRVSAAERNKWLKKNTDQEVTGTALAALKSAVTVDDVQAALKRAEFYDSGAAGSDKVNHP